MKDKLFTDENNLEVDDVMFEGLNDEVMKYAEIADKVKVVVGYASPDKIRELAAVAKNLSIVLGMYISERKAVNVYQSFCQLQESLPKTKLLYSKDRRHVKLYAFYHKNEMFACLSGSANLSDSGLTDYDNGEMLYRIAPASFDKLDSYINSRIMNSMRVSNYDYDRECKTAVSQHDKYDAIIPLYRLLGNDKIVYPRSGINWGNSNGHSRKDGPIEAYIPILSSLVDECPQLIPIKQKIKTRMDGKITRVNDTVTLVWDDDTEMEAIFSGNGVKRRGKLYPKQLTSSDGGGAILGGYLRDRMGLSPKTIVTYKHLVDYGRDNIGISLVGQGIYQVDFSV